MSVSIVIPARNAAPTLAQTLQSLQGQTFRDWEAILVDDGSTDETASIARAYAERDRRFRVIAQEPAGVSVARNRGLEAARREWVLFLDGDDWLRPTHLQKLTAAATSDRTFDGAWCRFARVAVDGVVSEQEDPWVTDSLFSCFAHTCVWAIHACVVRKSVIERVGGFPTGWRTCEDWDLWQRITRTGARFGYVPEVLALYRTRAQSASMDGRELLRGALRVVNQGHSYDARVPNPHPEYAAGLPAKDAPRARLATVCWPAALAIGHGADASELLREVEGDRDPFLSPWLVASCLYEAAPLPSGGGRHQWLDLLPKLSPAIDRFLLALEEHSGAPRLAQRAKTALEQLILARQSSSMRPISVGTTYSMTVDATAPIPDVHPSPDATRLVCHVTIGDRWLGVVHLPICDGFVPAAVLADAIAAELAWPIAGEWLEAAVFGRPLPGRATSAWAGRRVAARVGRLLGKKRADYESWAFASVAWLALVGEIFPRGGRRARVRAADDRIAVEIAEPLPDVSLSGSELEVDASLAGTPLGAVRIAAKSGLVRARDIRRAIVRASGFELCRRTVREALLERPFDTATPLGEQLARRARGRAAASGAANVRRIYGATSEEVVILPRRARDGIDTSASRRAIFPSGTVDVLRDLAHVASEPILREPGPDGRPPRVVYSPEVAAPASGPAPVVRVPSAGTRTLDVTTRLAQRAMPSLRRKLGSRALADRLPILMYHRIATSGPESLAPYRVAPAAFEQQLRFLQAAGYYSVTLEQWREAAAGLRTLRGKPILLTFDDGYRDFATDAWPLLSRYGFGALVLLVTDRVGGQSEWDRPFGEVFPLMGWEEILALQHDGCEFGAHTVAHPPLTSLDPAGIVREVAGARAVLERRLGRPVRTIAYPYGDFDPIVRHLTGACGFVFGLTCHSAPAQWSHPLLELPRLEVSGADGLERFVWKIEHRKWDSAVLPPAKRESP
jgi:peptidoglycan/xylan/chitin deacetylase (PgdA/CDA1 family)/GT2 family glycosyltransferase